MSSIISIINTKTGNPVCDYYKHKEINLSKCEIIVGKPLRIVHSNGTYFTHEIVTEISQVLSMIRINTIKKSWVITI